MIESHINPDKALSDAQQQVTPADYTKLIDGLIWRKEEINESFVNKLAELRDEIDGIDREIIEIIAKRMNVAKEIGQYKKENDITILQSSRWEEILDHRKKLGVDKGLTEDFMTELYRQIHKESIRQQSKVMN